MNFPEFCANQILGLERELSFCRLNLTLARQMKSTTKSDIIIGMHGAGLVNRFRWGYRNLCQLVGCQWHQYRSDKEGRS
ncbi:hypothetical protein CCR75_005588 [Bremia lactucae]|uniref:Uncharacterized protein n=1 Tax=Bremia lactucae TaxID=4779 RepID=A0A976P027_BRELC|nr:hypothetical protein CCR75_005588 [Bremia lactucae]